jgi:hypothetical protein
MHFIANQAGYTAALERGIPFYYAACGGAFPISELTTEGSRVDCGQCAAQVPVSTPGNSTPEPSPSLSAEDKPEPGVDQDLVNDSDFADFAEVEGMLGLEEKESVPIAETAPAPVVTPDPMASIGPILEMAMSGFSPDCPEWQRWLVPVDQPDPAGKLGSYGTDLRELLTEEERSFLCQLGQLSMMIGSDGLPMRVLAIVHRLANELAAFQVESGLLENEDEEIEEENKEG